MPRVSPILGMSRRADLDVWIRPAFKSNRFENFEMVLVYVDDILHLSHDTMPTMKALRKPYELQPELCRPPKMYLGVNVSK